MSRDAAADLCRTDPFLRLSELVERGGFPYLLHEHVASRTIADAKRQLLFDVARIVKTVAFRTRSGTLVLAALRGTRRVDYARLARLCGVNRRDLAPLSPVEVKELLGVEPGSVSPLFFGNGTVVLFDEDLLGILPTVYCGIGRPDRTLEMASADLARLACARNGAFSK